jgi:L-lysine exporter family protein LysE/ArgO
MAAYIAGFTLGLSLILAIGAQNAFVLRQGLKKQHVFVVCLICALSDAILVVVGVSGFGMIVKESPWIETMSRYGGAIFLGFYAIKSFTAAFRTYHSLDPAEEISTSLKKTVFICLAFTWLNPHVYLDTVVLLGSISTQFKAAKSLFAYGAVTASFLFFFTLGYGARILIPFFQKPVSWKVLDFVIGLIMLSISLSLVLV